MLKRVAVSVGDLNGVGIELILKNHKKISLLCEPIYCINKTMLQRAAKLLDLSIPDDFNLYEVDGDFNIMPSCIDAKSGKYSYESFLAAIKLAQTKQVDAIVTLPIHKEAWAKAGLIYKGHTDMMRDYFKKDAIMMLGCKEMFVALFSEHIPLKDVPRTMKAPKIKEFLLSFYSEVNPPKVAVLGLNPHAGDGGVLGDEESEIKEAIESANATLKQEIFFGPIVPDTAFTPHSREGFTYFVAMYHDQGLAPLKALYFEQSINVSLNLPIKRTSVDHGTAFDIAYKNSPLLSSKSYLNAIGAAI